MERRYINTILFSMCHKRMRDAALCGDCALIHPENTNKHHSCHSMPIFATSGARERRCYCLINCLHARPCIFFVTEGIRLCLGLTCQVSVPYCLLHRCFLFFVFLVNTKMKSAFMRFYNFPRATLICLPTCCFLFRSW